MRSAPWVAILAAALAAGGCATESKTKAVEVLDEQSGMTFAALDQPVELLPDLSNTVLTTGKRATFAYLGPVEWDRMGTITYGLWVHVAPGNDRQPGNIRAPGVTVLDLDDGPLTLTLMDPPKLGKEPYHDAVSWGESAYFEMNAETLRRIAASIKLGLTVPGADGEPMTFAAGADAHGVLSRYAVSRGIGSP